MLNTTLGSDLSSSVTNVIGQLTVTSDSSAITPALLLTVDDESAFDAPDIVLRRASASPAAQDELGALYFQGDDSSSIEVNYSALWSEINSTTSGSHNSNVYIQTSGFGTSSSASGTDEANADIEIASTGIDIRRPLTLSGITGTGNFISIDGNGLLTRDNGTAAVETTWTPTWIRGAMSNGLIQNAECSIIADGNSRLLNVDLEIVPAGLDDIALEISGVPVAPTAPGSVNTIAEFFGANTRTRGVVALRGSILRFFAMDGTTELTPNTLPGAVNQPVRIQFCLPYRAT